MERDGFILLHRKGLSKEEWKHPIRTLAWIDFLTMAAWQDFTAPDGVYVGLGQVIASYGFLATRWGVSKANAHRWIQHWILEKQVERLPERCVEREAERFFVVNYAKYQGTAERAPERLPERALEQMKVKQVKENRENNTYACRPETEALYETIVDLSNQFGFTMSVNKKALDIIVTRYVGKIHMKVELQHCFSWLAEKNLRKISSQRIGNWFKKATEIQKRNALRLLEAKEAKNSPYVRPKKADTNQIDQSVDHFAASQLPNE